MVIEDLSKGEEHPMVVPVWAEWDGAEEDTEEVKVLVKRELEPFQYIRHCRIGDGRKLTKDDPVMSFLSDNSHDLKVAVEVVYRVQLCDGGGARIAEPRRPKGRLQAAGDIKKGEVMMQYAGEVLFDPEGVHGSSSGGSSSGSSSSGGSSSGSSNNHHRRDRTYWFNVFDNELYENGTPQIDAKYAGNCARFLSHSCQPNAEIGRIGPKKKKTPGKQKRKKSKPVVIFPVTTLRSRKAIKKGDELTFDYNLVDDHLGPESCFLCLCGHCEAHKRRLLSVPLPQWHPDGGDRHQVVDDRRTAPLLTRGQA
jgi:hypothetical protein